MIAIDNTGLAGLGLPPVNLTGFDPEVTFVYSTSAKTITATDASAFPSGDSFKKINVTVNDAEGGTVYGVISATTGNTGALDVSALALTAPLIVKASVASTKGCLGDGIATGISIAGSGSVGNWQVTFTTAI